MPAWMLDTVALIDYYHGRPGVLPYVEAIAAEGGRSQAQVESLMNHIERRHDYLNNFIEPLLE